MCGASASAASIPESIAPSGGGTPRRMAWRIPLLAAGAVALLAGLFGGLWRLGWALPHGESLAALHGPLLVSGLFGTLISLERAVAIGRDWPYAAPVLSALGTLALLAGAPVEAGAAAHVLAALVLGAASLLVALRQPALCTGTLLFGALAWFAGNILWLVGRPVPEAAGWWLAFLVLTIAGEHLELSRRLPTRRRSQAAFLFAMGLLAAGAQNGVATDNGAVLFGLGLCVTAAWLLRHDIARRNARTEGQTRFSARCMLAGYAWLALAGAALIGLAATGSPFGYDVALHAVLVGFVLSTVFGHALLILPAVTGVRLRYRPVLYGPLAILHGAVAMRVAGGALEWDLLRLWSGPAVVLALASFAACLAAGGRRAADAPLSAVPAPADRP